MAKYQKYAEYKDSGLEWLGGIPSHWEIKKLKYLGEAIIGLTYSPDDVVDEGEGTLVLRSSNIQNKRLAFDDNVYVKKEIPEKLKTQKNDILICARNGSRALIGKNALIDESAEGVSFGAFMSIFRSQYNNYLSKVFNSALFEYQSGTFLTATINQLTTGNLNSFEVPLPPIQERDLIVNFLDHETAQIDTLIAKQEKLIELLKEKRQAVISYAVTKGLNPDVAMKDSGVEWLGQVPASWLVTPLKYLIAPKRGAVKAGPFGSHLKNSDMEGQDIKVISQKNVIANDLNLGEAMISEKKYRELEVFTIEQDDVLVTTRGTIGRTCVFKENFKAILHPCLIRLQVDHNKVLPELIALIIQESGYEMEQILVKSNATTIEVIYSDNLINTVVVIPNSLEEQKQVLSYIDNQKAYFDKALKKANQMIQKLIERRTALISAAVTGKIDVRHHASRPSGNDKKQTEGI